MTRVHYCERAEFVCLPCQIVDRPFPRECGVEPIGNEHPAGDAAHDPSHRCAHLYRRGKMEPMKDKDALFRPGNHQHEIIHPGKCKALDARAMPTHWVNDGEGDERQKEQTNTTEDKKREDGKGNAWDDNGRDETLRQCQSATGWNTLHHGGRWQKTTANGNGNTRGVGQSGCGPQYVVASRLSRCPS